MDPINTTPTNPPTSKPLTTVAEGDQEEPLEVLAVVQKAKSMWDMVPYLQKNGVCKWLRCGKKCGEIPDFVQHLAVTHCNVNQCVADCRAQAQVVRDLRSMLVEESQRLYDMVQHKNIIQAAAADGATNADRRCSDPIIARSEKMMELMVPGQESVITRTSSCTNISELGKTPRRGSDQVPAGGKRKRSGTSLPVKKRSGSLQLPPIVPPDLGQQARRSVLSRGPSAKPLDHWKITGEVPAIVISDSEEPEDKKPEPSIAEEKPVEPLPIASGQQPGCPSKTMPSHHESKETAGNENQGEMTGDKIDQGLSTTTPNELPSGNSSTTVSTLHHEPRCSLPAALENEGVNQADDAASLPPKAIIQADPNLEIECSG